MRVARSGFRVLYRGVGVTAVREEGESVATREHRFSSFCIAVEPRLRRALVAAYGPDLGSEAAADALSWAWENFERVETMDNPAGYLWRVGQTSVRGTTRHRSWMSSEPSFSTTSTDADFKPALVGAMSALPPRQRAAVLLVHGYGYSLSEAADQMGCRIRTLRHHLDRGLVKLRHSLGVTDDA